MKKIIIAYVPVIHAGYKNFLEGENAEEVYVVSEDIIKTFPELDYVTRKDFLRALPSGLIVISLKSLGFNARALDLTGVKKVSSSNDDVFIVMPNEDVSAALAKRHFLGKKIEFRDIFLRWHSGNVTAKKEVNADRFLSRKDFESEVMAQAFAEGQKSWDWWRQVGGLIVKNDEVLLSAHNSHVPDKQMPYVFGDPRSVFKKGINLELSTAEHAEAILIATAARKGIPLEGTILYITDFPCPPCAKLISEAGIKKCYFCRGYAMVDGESILKSKGVEIIRVIENPPFGN